MPLLSRTPAPATHQALRRDTCLHLLIICVLRLHYTSWRGGCGAPGTCGALMALAAAASRPHSFEDHAEP